MSALEKHIRLQVPDKVAMIDIDGTLIDAHYRVTDNRIYETIEEAQAQGWSIGLSSDTPRDVMIEWKEHFGMTGPVISEKGAFVQVDKQSVITPDRPYDFVGMRNAFIDTLRNTDVVIYEGDPVSAIKAGERIGEPGDTVILVNSYREYSAGIFTRTVDENGKLIIDNEKTNQYVEQVRALYPDDHVFDEDLNHNHGLLIVSHPEMSKRVGTIELSRMMNIGKIAMIGNSFADYVGDDIAVHLAVGDASEEYKTVSDYVAPRAVTKGVVDALTVLMNVNR